MPRRNEASGARVLCDDASPRPWLRVEEARKPCQKYLPSKPLKAKNPDTLRRYADLRRHFDSGFD